MQTPKLMVNVFHRFQRSRDSFCGSEVAVLPKKFEDKELEALLHEGCYQIQKDLAKSLGAIQAAISKRLQASGFIEKQGNWAPYELKLRDLCISEMMLERIDTKAKYPWR